MYFLIILALLMGLAFLSVYFGTKVGGNEGRNIGEKYMKEHWGIDEEKKS